MKLIAIAKAREVIKHHLQDKVPFRTAYKFTRFLKETETQDDFYNEKLRELVELYGKKGDDGRIIYSNGMLTLQEDKIRDWTEKIEELYNTEVETPSVVFEPSDFDGLNVTTGEIGELIDFIKGD